MQRRRTDTIDIKPEQGSDYADRTLPEDVTQQLNALTGLAGIDAAPETLGELVALSAHTEAFTPQGHGTEELLIAEDSRHEVRWADRTAHTYCILDALILGIIEDEPVEITTQPPGSDQTIELVASPEGIQGGDEEMVVSFGFSNQLPEDPKAFEQASRQEVLALGHEYGCPMINLFEDANAYEAWASQADGLTVPMSLPQALALAKDTVEVWNA